MATPDCSRAHPWGPEGPGRSTRGDICYNHSDIWSHRGDITAATAHGHTDHGRRRQGRPIRAWMVSAPMSWRRQPGPGGRTMGQIVHVMPLSDAHARVRPFLPNGFFYLCCSNILYKCKRHDSKSGVEINKPTLQGKRTPNVPEQPTVWGKCEGSLCLRRQGLLERWTRPKTGQDDSLTQRCSLSNQGTLAAAGRDCLCKTQSWVTCMCRRERHREP